MTLHQVENRGTDNKLGGPRKTAAAVNAKLPAEENSATVSIGKHAATESVELLAQEAATSFLTHAGGKAVSSLLGFFGIGDLIVNGAIHAWKEAHLPPDTLRLAFADGYAAGLTYLTFGRNSNDAQPIGWRLEHAEAFESGKADALRDFAAAPQLTESQFFQQVLHSRAIRLNVKPLLAADTAISKRKQRYGG